MAQATLKDVAQEVGMSAGSVSDILNERRRELYRAATVEKVLAAARNLGYQAHAGARMLRQGKSTLIGIATRPQILDWHTVNELIVATHDDLSKRNLQPVMVDPEQMVPGKSFAPFPSPEMLAGIISIDLSMEQHVPDFYKVLAARMPIVALYPVKNTAIDCVTTDRALGIEVAFEHLWGSGHRRIAFVEEEHPESLTAAAKLSGWKRGWRKRKCKPRDEYFIACMHADIPIVRGEKAAHVLLQMDEESRPTAVVCTSDEVALSMMCTLSEAGWRIPEDLSVVGFDDVRHAQYSIPQLTTVSQPVTAMAHAAVKRLCDLIELGRQEQDWQPQQKLLAPQLVVRNSTQAI